MRVCVCVCIIITIIPHILSVGFLFSLRTLVLTHLPPPSSCDQFSAVISEAGATRDYANAMDAAPLAREERAEQR